jgi:hypothetical protein
MIGLPLWFYILIQIISLAALFGSAYFFIKLYQILGYKGLWWFILVPIFCIALRFLTISADFDVIDDLPGKELLTVSYVLFFIGTWQLVVAVKKFIKNGTNGKH